MRSGKTLKALEELGKYRKNGLKVVYTNSEEMRDVIKTTFPDMKVEIITLIEPHKLPLKNAIIEQDKFR